MTTLAFLEHLVGLIAGNEAHNRGCLSDSARKLFVDETRATRPLPSCAWHP